MVKQTNEVKVAKKAKVMMEDAIQRAVEMYWDGLEEPESSRPGFRAVCIAVEKAVKGESGIEVKISSLSEIYVECGCASQSCDLYHVTVGIFSVVYSSIDQINTTCLSPPSCHSTV